MVHKIRNQKRIERTPADTCRKCKIAVFFCLLSVRCQFSLGYHIGLISNPRKNVNSFLRAAHSEANGVQLTNEMSMGNSGIF